MAAERDAQTPGRAQRLGPLVRRVLADNPSAFTSTGTETYIVGTGEVAVIDPGPDLPAHVEAILAETAGERIVAILCTHTHRDHSPAARSLADASGAPIVGCAAMPDAGVGSPAEAGFDRAYRPDRALADGATVTGAGWTLEAVATPGHTSNHLCYALPEACALFTGDHVMGWSTTVVSPPDGDMAAYMASLGRLQERDDAIYYPAHGDPIEEPRRYVRALAGHRRSREAQIRRAIEEAPATVAELVGRLYVGLDPRLIGGAGGSVLAHLLDLEGQGAAVRGEGGRWLAA